MPLRLFIALTLPEDVRAHLGQVRTRLAGSAGGVSWTPAANLHATLKFLGDVEETRVPALAEALSRLEPWKAFVLKPSGVVCFGRPTRVIAAALCGESPGFRQLRDRIESACVALGFAPEGREPVAHVTLGRVPRPRLALAARMEADARPLWPGPDWVVRDFALVRSTLKPAGAEFRIMTTFAAGEVGTP